MEELRAKRVARWEIHPTPPLGWEGPALLALPAAVESHLAAARESRSGPSVQPESCTLVFQSPGGKEQLPPKLKVPLPAPKVARA